MGVFYTFPDHDSCSVMCTKYIHYALALFLFGCYEETDRPEQLKIINAIISQIPGPINFKSIADEKWSRVCFFGPYTSKSTDVLGFEWRVESKTEIGGNESINVIAFATEKEVTEFVVIPRAKVDFAAMSRQCFPRNDAIFIYDSLKSSYVRKNSLLRNDTSIRSTR